MCPKVFWSSAYKQDGLGNTSVYSYCIFLFLCHFPIWLQWDLRKNVTWCNFSILWPLELHQAGFSSLGPHIRFLPVSSCVITFLTKSEHALENRYRQDHMSHVLSLSGIFARIVLGIPVSRHLGSTHIQVRCTTPGKCLSSLSFCCSKICWALVIK